MPSSKEETTEQKIARLEQHERVGLYKNHCENVEKNEKHPDVVRYWKVNGTYNATKGKKAVKEFVSARGGKASKKDLDKMRKGDQDIRDFEEAEIDMNQLADKEPVKKHRRATDAKKGMERELEVVQYNMAKEIWKANKETNEVKNRLPQPSSSSSAKSHPKVPWIKERAQGYLPMKAPTPPRDVSNKTTRVTPRGRSRDRSNPQTGPKPPASASKNVEPKINSGKNRVPSPHTEAELHFKDSDQDVVRKVMHRKWGLE